MACSRRWSVLFFIFFVLLRVTRTELLYSGIRDSVKGPAHEFSHHAIIRPRIYHGRTKRQISSTHDAVDGGHVHDLTIGYDLNGTDYVLDLRLNRELIPKQYFQRYQHNGQHVVNRPTGKEVQLCQYQGHIRNKHNSWAAISTCHGLSGVIFDGEELHYLEPTLKGDNHFLYKHSDIVTNQTCGYSGTPHHILENNEFNRILRYKRSAEIIRGPYSANLQSRYVELVLVVDNKEYKELEENLTKVHNHCKEIANIINALYMPLNIFIALVGVVVWTETDEINLSVNGDTTLTNFLHYRRERLVKEHPNDNAQLLTRVQFEGGVVGKALKGPICTYEFSGGVSMDHSNIVGLVATTVAHEMGHNLGMEHDTSDCKCQTERCIMAPSSSSLSPTHWSNCSLDYLAIAFDHGMDYCLRNKPTSLFDGPVCGNGFVEAGEQCDCGLKDRCNNPCCNATSCMLYGNASCATGECCDLKTCRPKSAGSECRQAHHECDLPEYCTGQGEYCPEDVYKMDSETCDRGKAFCYQGSCRTHTDQCKLLWGPSGKSSDTLCYQMNTNGTRHGNCGFNKLNKSYIKCNNENIYCGMLHCRHLNERLEFGMESVSILSHSFINSGGSIIPCRTAIVDLGLNEVDPGLAPDGAKCGDGKMCVNQKCMPVGSLRQQTGMCPMDCNGNGVCNSKGHCHCQVGFSPPNCDFPGSGGSQDSGPASNPDAQRDIVTAFYIIFLGIIPFFALIGMFIYYTRHRGNAWWKKSQLTSDASSPSSKTGRKSPPRRISRGNSLAFVDSGARTLEISSPLNARHGSDNAHASLLSDPLGTTIEPKPVPVAGASLTNNLFGHFKGFSITPISPTSPTLPPKTGVVPLPPRLTTNTGPANVKLHHLNKSSSSGHEKLPNTFLSSVNAASMSPALPPANPNSNARPLISSPVLDTTTCTVKELSCVRNPTRAAPEIPKVVASLPELVAEEPKTEANYPTLTRLASFMLRQNPQNQQAKKKVKPDKAKPLVLGAMKSSKLQIDREALRNIEISNPIPQQEIESTPNMPLEDLESAKQVVMRAQSLRDNTTVKKRADIQSFGSMRGAKRPTSIPPSVRPTSPPPRPPPPPVINPTPQDPGIIGLPGYQNPPEYAYDDCLNLISDGVAPLANIDEESPTSGDNIYAVIEESPPQAGRKVGPLSPKISALSGRSTFDYSSPTFSEYKTPKPIENSTSAGSVESVGLLSEIVSEIQARNVESIYSSGNGPKKEDYNSNDELATDVSIAGSNSPQLYPDQASNSSFGTYVNASNIYRPYSNMSNQKSSASSTCSSNGYLSPTKLKASQLESQATIIKPIINPSKVPLNSAPGLKSAQPNTSSLFGAAAKQKPAVQSSVGYKPTVPPAGYKPTVQNSQPSAKPSEGHKPTVPSTSYKPAVPSAGYKPTVQNSQPSNQPSVGFKATIQPSQPSVKPSEGYKPTIPSTGYKPTVQSTPASIQPSVGSKPTLQSTEPSVQPTQGYKPYSSSLHRSLGPFAASFKNNQEPLPVQKPKEEIKPLVLSVSEVSSILKSADTKPLPPATQKRDLVSPPSKSTIPVNKSKLNRSPTPPSLSTNMGKPSLNNSSKAPTSLPKKVGSPLSNSPDLVSSCNTSNTRNKSPDVLQIKSDLKQVVRKQPPASLKPKASSVGKSLSDEAGKLSHVASLQQKFESASTDKSKPLPPRTLSNVAIKKKPLVTNSSTSSFKK